MSDYLDEYFGEGNADSSAVVPIQVEPEPQVINYDLSRCKGSFEGDCTTKIIKMPPSNVLTTKYFSLHPAEDPKKDKSSAAKMLCRRSSDGTVESNTYLVQWDDGTYTLFVGNEAFKVFERDEQVHLYEKVKDEAGNLSCLLDSGFCDKQFIVTPASLDSKIHKQIAEKTSLESKKLMDKRKTVLTGNVAENAGTGPSPSAPSPFSSQQRLLTAAFLEDNDDDDKTGSNPNAGIKELKDSFKRRKKTLNKSMGNGGSSTVVENATTTTSKDKRGGGTSSSSSSSSSLSASDSDGTSSSSSNSKQ